MNPHEHDVLETLQRLINHYGRAAVRKDAAPAVFEPDVAIAPGCWKDVLWPTLETPPRHGKSTWPDTPGYFVTVDPDLDPTKTHTAVLCVDGSPYAVTFTSGADPHKALAEALRAAGLGAEARDGAVRLSPGYTATVTPPAPPGPPNRAQRRLRPGKRPPDTSAKNAGPAWRGGR